MMGQSEGKSSKYKWKFSGVVMLFAHVEFSATFVFALQADQYARPRGEYGSFATLQHLNKLHNILISEGHLATLLLGKKNIKQDHSRRRHICDMDVYSPIAAQVKMRRLGMEGRAWFPLKSWRRRLRVQLRCRERGNHPRAGSQLDPRTIHSVETLWDKLKGNSNAASGAGAAEAETATPDSSDREDGEKSRSL
jgi:hypothetical protein